MTRPTVTYPETYLQQAAGCLGVCRHYCDLIAQTHLVNDRLPEVVLALEIAMLLLRQSHDLAHDRLCYCARICSAAIVAWKNNLHPHYQLSADACRTFVAFWQGEELRLTA